MRKGIDYAKIRHHLKKRHLAGSKPLHIRLEVYVAGGIAIEAAGKSVEQVQVSEVHVIEKIIRYRYPAKFAEAKNESSRSISTVRKRNAWAVCD